MKIENIENSNENLEKSDEEVQSSSKELSEEVEEKLVQNNPSPSHQNSDDMETLLCELTPETIGQKLWKISVAFDESRKNQRPSNPSRKRLV